MSKTREITNKNKEKDKTMNDDLNEAPFVEKIKRNPDKWKGKPKGDKWANKAKKAWKNRERELEEDALDEDVRDLGR
jgi:hypothetical protein